MRGLHLRTSTERACASSPSARANSSTTGARRPNACARYFLHADAFHEIGDGKAAARARHSAGRQHVVRAAGVIAERLRAPIAEENASGGVNAVERGLRLARQAQMFGRKEIHEARPPRRDCGRPAPRHFGERAPREIRLREARTAGARFPRRRLGRSCERCGHENRDRVADRARPARSDRRR